MGMRENQQHASIKFTCISACIVVLLLLYVAVCFFESRASLFAAAFRATPRVNMP